jgi:hypothetical protein
MFVKPMYGVVIGIAGLTGLAMAQSASAPASQAAASQSAPATRPPASRPAGSEPASEPRVHAVLQRLEQRGDSVKDLRSKIEWQVLDRVIDDKQAKFGELLFKRDKPHDMFLVRFHRTVVEDQVIDKPEEHLFDGRFYIEKRDATKTVIKREIVRPGEQFDPFKLGQGPFPLPFGQKEAEILEKFTVSFVEPAKDDPAGTSHLKLLPRPTAQDMADKYKELHFFVDNKLDLPVKVVADQKDDKLVTVLFSDIRVNTGLAGSAFAIQVPDDATWSVSVESLPPENPEGAEPGDE